MEFFIGTMVIGIIAGVFVMTILFGSEKGFFVGSSGGKRLTILFEKGSGISQNSLVLKNGIKIGRVFSVELDDEPENSSVRVSFELEPQYKIYSNEYAKINRTLLGDASIEFVDDPDYVGDIFEIVDSDDVIKGRNTGDLMGTVSSIEGDLAQALQNINTASQGVTRFMENVNDIIGDETELQLKKERLQNVFSELEGALSSIRSLASNMDAVVSDPEIIDNIRRATSEAPNILERATELTDGAKKFMSDANAMSADIRKTLARAETTFDLVDKNLDNVNVFTTSLAENGPEMMTALNESSVEIKETINKISTAVINISDLAASLNEKLDDPDSIFGMLHDEETTKSIKHIVKNAEEITQKLYPILDDARVFSNKVAHKPSSLIWDKTTTKGGSGNTKYGFQSLSPTGGLTSSLFRQTPNGSRIRERNYYEPLADERFMDERTKSAYQETLARLDSSRAANRAVRAQRLYPDNYSQLLPPTSADRDYRAGYGDAFSPAAKTNRVKRCLESFWDRMAFWRQDSKSTDAASAYAMREYAYANDDAELYGDEYCDEYYADGTEGSDFGGEDDYGMTLVGYDSGVDGAYGLGQPSYETLNSAPGCAAPGCDVPGCDVPGCDVPGGGASNGRAPKASFLQGGYGNRADDPRPAGAYGVPFAGEKLDFSLADDEEGEEYQEEYQDYAEEGEYEELPTSINRRAKSPKVGADSPFEDDGLPLEFAPPTR